MEDHSSGINAPEKYLIDYLLKVSCFEGIGKHKKADNRCQSQILDTW